MRLLSLAGVLCIALSSGLWASSPHLVNFQGELTDSAGNPVADTTYSVTFRIYTVSSGGAAVWSETQNVSTAGGLFDVLLGAGTPFDPASAFGDSLRYLGIQVGGDPEISPRTRLVSTPYALRAEYGGGWIERDTVMFADSTKRVGVGTVQPVSRLHVVGLAQDMYAADFESSKNGIKSVAVGNDGAITGVYGEAANSGAYGFSYGVYGRSIGSQENFAVFGNAFGGYLNIALRGDAVDDSAMSNYAVSGYARGGENARGVDVTAEYAATENLGVKSTATGGQLATSLKAEATGGGVATTGVSASANGSFGNKYGVIANATGSGYNIGILSQASGGSTNFAGYFVKGYAGVDAAANSIVVFENSTNGYLSILTPDINERGILFGEPANEAAGGIVYNSGSIPDGFSFRTLDNSTKMALTATGRLGIGTSAPGSGLHVKGTGFPTSFGYFDTYGSLQDAGLRFYEAGAVKSHLFHNASTNTLDLLGEGNAGISIAANGTVGLGTYTPNYTLDVRGTIGNNATLYHSDRRWKQNILTLPDALTKVEDLRGVTFDWKRNEFADMDFPEGKQIGLIAQEVEDVFPELVSAGADGYKSVDYARLTPILVEAIKELKAQKDEEVGALRKQVVDLQELVKQLAGKLSTGESTYGMK